MPVFRKLHSNGTTSFKDNALNSNKESHKSILLLTWYYACFSPYAPEKKSYLSFI